jgi:hypothetical protein
MLRKLIALALVAAGIAAVIKKRGEAGGAAPSPEPAGGEAAGGEAAGAGGATATGEAADAGGEAADAGGEGEAAAAPDQPDPADLDQVRSGQTEATIEAPVAGVGDDEQAAIPDVSATDPNVREQEQAAASEAGSIGGSADTVSADVDPEMRPVYEGSGGDPETFETTDEQGR